MSPASLTFTSANWNTPQTVTVNWGRRCRNRRQQARTRLSRPQRSAQDANYNNLDAADVAVTNIDNDELTSMSAATSALVTTEAGGTATFSVRPRTQPTAYVTIGLSSSDTTEGTVSPASLTFTPENWNTSQIVTVTGVNDAIFDGDVAYTICHGGSRPATIHGTTT